MVWHGVVRGDVMGCNGECHVRKVEVVRGRDRMLSESERRVQWGRCTWIRSTRMGGAGKE
jgi:hypothetical protein